MRPTMPMRGARDLESASRQQDDAPVPIKATLIVAPATILDQWLEEFMVHVEQDAICVCVPSVLP